MITGENVRVCRLCGHVDAVESSGRCPSCDAFSGLVTLPRGEAERIARRYRRRAMIKRLAGVAVGLTLVSAAALWSAQVFWDRGLRPPKATTQASARVAPNVWGQVRRTPQNTGFTSEPAPYPHRIQWTYTTPKPLSGTPAVADQHVYLITEDGRTVALDRQTGRLVWDHDNGGPSGSSPAVVGDDLIVASRPGVIAALHRQNGTPRWTTSLGHAVLASPIVMHGTVFIGAADQNLYALDVATGEQRWAFATESWVVSAVAYAGDRVITTSQDNRVYVVGSETGRMRLIYETGPGRHVGTSAVVQGNLAYFGSFRGRVWAVDWRGTTYPLERWMLFWKTNFFFWGWRSKPPIQKGTVWSARIDGDVTQTLALAHHTVYAGTNTGQVGAFDANTGAVRWKTDLGVRLTSAPTVAGDTVLIGTQRGAVMALDARTGSPQWTFQTQGRITASPVVAGGVMYVASHDGTLYAVEATP
jgi:outer membrane protein assembly factor BamB